MTSSAPRFLSRLSRPPRDADASRPACLTNDDGDERLVGVEVEFNGATIGEAVDAIVRATDGTPGERTDYEWYVDSEQLGRLTIELDHHTLKTTARERGTRPAGVVESLFASAAAPFVPVELVTEPIAPETIVELDAVTRALADAGAIGTREGLLHAYGVHYNPQIASADPLELHAVLRAFAVLQDWLFGSLDVDLSRTTLPFVDAFDDAYVTELIDGEPPSSLAQLVEQYIAANPTRNRALDALPLFMELAPDVVERNLDAPALKRVKARPTWHFRLTDSRIGEEGWSVVRGWRHWLVVEDLAGDPERLDEMAEATRRHRSLPLGEKVIRWADEVTSWLR